MASSPLSGASPQVTKSASSNEGELPGVTIRKQSIPSQLVQCSSTSTTIPLKPRHQPFHSLGLLPCPKSQLLDRNLAEPADKAYFGPISLRARLPLTSVRIDVTLSFTMGSPSRTLLTNHHISKQDPFGVEIYKIMWNQSMPHLRFLLSERKMTLYSMVETHNLFYVSRALETFILVPIHRLH